MNNKLSFNPDGITKVSYTYAWWDGIFSDEEIKKIEDYCSSFEFEKGKVHSTNDVDAEVRKSNIKFVKYNGTDNQWLFEKLAATAEWMNQTFFNFDLVGFDHFQYTTYDSPGQKYDFHTDMWWGNTVPPDHFLTRKLSLSIILSDPSEYTGGDFEIATGGSGSVETLVQKKGRVFAFPSFITHRVSPIITGCRKSLVVWVTGPKWK